MKVVLKFRFWRIVLCCAIALMPTLALPQHARIPQHSLAPQTYAIAAKSRLHMNGTALHCSGELLLNAVPANNPANAESATLNLELHATPKYPALESIRLLIPISKSDFSQLLQGTHHIQGTLAINHISQPLTLKTRLQIKHGSPHTLKLSSTIVSHEPAFKHSRIKLKATLILSELL